MYNIYINATGHFKYSFILPGHKTTSSPLLISYDRVWEPLSSSLAPHLISREYLGNVDTPIATIASYLAPS